MPKALAFSNNDIAVIAWAYEQRLAGCLGFAVHRGDVHAGTWQALPALAKFGVAGGDAAETTEQAPVQKFWWRDLGCRKGGLYQYKVVPMGGRPGALVPLAGIDPVVSNPVAVTHDRGLFKAYFNRGILATQSVAKALGTPSVPRLMRHIADPTDPLRQALEGKLPDALEALLDAVDDGAGEVRAALYELDDPKGLEVRLQAKDRGDPAKRAVILGNEPVAADKETGAPATDDKDSADRAALKGAGVPVIDRMLPKGQIPHNKFMVLKRDGVPASVLTGSTNWTMNALAAQTNNALLIDSPAVAARYAAYWDELERDTGGAADGSGHWQGPDLRAWTRTQNAAMLQSGIALEDGSATVRVMFSPNTDRLLARPPKEKPADMEFIFDLMSKARQAILFLAFEPGNNSILDAAGRALRANPSLFVRGALTSASNAQNFKEALGGSEDTAPEGPGKRPRVAAIGESATGKPEPDYRVIPAMAVTKSDAFGAWEAELNKAGFAIIHDKILVIDPFGEGCAVVTGSHKLGYRASHDNDENLVVVQGHRSLAEAYACHVLDVYDHYAWRWWLSQKPDEFGKPLDPTDGWQDRYVRNGEVVSAELKFWLSAIPGVVAHVAAAPPPGSNCGPRLRQASRSRGGRADDRDALPPRLWSAWRANRICTADGGRSGVAERRVDAGVERAATPG